MCTENRSTTDAEATSAVETGSGGLPVHAGAFLAASVEKEPPDQNPVIAEHARDGNDGERHNQPDSEHRSLVA